MKVVTVHKSKGLEYPLVYLPFAVTARKTDKRGKSFFDYVDEKGDRHIDLALTDDARDAVDHGAAVDDGAHAGFDEFLALGDQRVVVRLAVRRARRHRQ